MGRICLDEDNLPHNRVIRGNNLTRNDLAIGITILFIISSVTPMTIGQDAETTNVDDEIKEKLDGLRFMCTTPNGFLEEKYKYYKEQLIKHYLSETPNDDIVVESLEEGLFLPVEPLSSPISNNGPMNSAWPMYCHDTRHTGKSPYSTENNPGIVKWRFSCDWMESSIAIDDDGIIYFGDAENVFYALYPNGTIKWEYDLGLFGGILGSSPAINSDGTIYIGSWDDYLYAIYPNGTIKWRFCANDDISSSPAIAEDGTIYFGTMLSGNNIYALNPNGTEKWHYTTGYAITSDPAIGSDGNIYIGSGDYYLYALYPNGTLRWRFQTGYYIKGSPSIAQDGTIYIGSYDNYLYALYPNNGTEKWRCQIGSGTETNPSIAADGTIYVGDDKLYAIYPNGTMRWSFNLGPNRHIHQSSPAISDEGTIYVGVCIGETSGGEIIAVNPDGTEKWRKNIANKWVESSPAIAEDGTVYIGSTYDMGVGYLYAFGRGDLEADAHGPYYGILNEPVQFTGSASGGYPPYSWQWDFGDGNSSEEQNTTHIYSKSGNYTVTLKIIDSHGNFSTNATYAWVQSTNDPPETPNVDGPTEGNIDTTYIYNVCSHDEYSLPVWYYIDWGDDSNTGWFGPNPSDTIISKTHQWSEKGTYTVKVKAKDPYDAESDWGTLVVIMPVSVKVYEFPLLRLLCEILSWFPNLTSFLTSILLKT